MKMQIINTPNMPPPSIQLSPISFSGELATPGLWLTITRITHGEERLYHPSHTGLPKLGCALAPINSVIQQIHGDVHLYRLAQVLQSKSWTVSDCQFDMIGLGPLEQRHDCKGLPFIDLCRVAHLACDLITHHLDCRSLPYTKRKYRTGKHPAPDERIIRIAETIFMQFMESSASFLKHAETKNHEERS